MISFPLVLFEYLCYVLYRKGTRSVRMNFIYVLLITTISWNPIGIGHQEQTILYFKTATECVYKKHEAIVQGTAIVERGIHQGRVLKQTFAECGVLMN